MSSSSPMQAFYKNKIVFLTGFTGFLGHSIFEKLMRSCPDIKRVYLLIRPKKGLNSKDRLKKLFTNDFFNRLKQERPDFVNHVSIIDGDLFKDNLGLSQQDIDIFINEVDIVIHSAATVKFDEKMKIAVKLNICSTKCILDLIKKCKNFKCFVHVSTAYSNSYQNHANEQFYPPKMDPLVFIEKANNTDEDILECIKPELIGDHPNTYTFTKNLAEHVVNTEGKGLPVCVVRPSIIFGAFDDPYPGWTGSNISGPFGIMVGLGVGLIRILNLDKNARVDFIPVDMVANTILAAAYNTAQKTKHDQTDIYNIVSGNSNPITWEKHMILGTKATALCPPYKSFWTATTFNTSCVYWFNILKFILHTIPAYIFDFLFLIMGKKPFFVDMYQKIHTAMKATNFFVVRDFDFKDENTRKLYFSLNKEDQKIFNFDVKKIEWDLYHICTIKSIRIGVLRDPISTVPQGITQTRWRSLLNTVLLVLIVHYTFSPVSLIIIGTILFCVKMYSY